MAETTKRAGIQSRYRTHTCGGLRKSDSGTEIRLSGWVHRVRDHGGVLFIDLRDHYGLTQVVADPDSAAFKMAETVRSEWVITVEGLVRDRPAGTTNADLPTGEIEIFAKKIEVLSQAKELPLPVFGEPDYPEDVRLTYRFLDLRRETLHGVIMKRLAITRAIRERMHGAGFNEFPTPILSLAEAIATSDIPAGVVNILTGQRAELAPCAAEHHDVDNIVDASGDTALSAIFQAGAAVNLKRVHTWKGTDVTPYQLLQLTETKTTWHPVGG